MINDSLEGLPGKVIEFVESKHKELHPILKQFYLIDVDYLLEVILESYGKEISNRLRERLYCSTRKIEGYC